MAADRISWSGSVLVGNQAGGQSVINGFGPVPRTGYVFGVVAASGHADPNGIGNAGQVDAAIQLADAVLFNETWELRTGRFSGQGLPFAFAQAFNSSTASSIDPNGSPPIWFDNGGRVAPLSFLNTQQGQSLSVLIDSYAPSGYTGNFPLQFESITLDLYTAADLSGVTGAPWRSKLEMGCLQRKGGAYVSIIGAENMPAAIQIDLGPTPAEFLLISPGLFNSGGVANNGSIGLRIYPGRILPVASPPAFVTTYPALGVPVHTQVGTFPVVIPWGQALQFVVEVYSTTNIPANSSFEASIEAYDLQ